MKRYLFKSFLPMLLVMLLVLPAMVYASNEGNVTIKSVYFRNAEGNMVYVDYEKATDDAMNGDLTLYDAIKEYVGAAEAKGRALYIETNTGNILDYRLAMIDGLFRLEDVIDNEKYEYSGEVQYTHVLTVIDGVAKIVRKEDVKDPVEPVDIVSISPISSVTVPFGTPEDEAIELLPDRTTITDSEGNTHTVYLNWTIENYNGNEEGEYTAIGTFELPAGIENNLGLTLEVITKVIVDSPWPKEVESVVVGVSAITERTYANINISEEYISEVEAVYVNGMLANQVEDETAQWRIEVEKGTTEDSLKGKVVVQLKKPPEDTEPKAIATYNTSYLSNFGMVRVEVNNLDDAAKFSVVYHLADNEDGTENIAETAIVNIGEEAGLVFYDLEQYDAVDIEVFDDENNLIYTFENVILVQ